MRDFKLTASILKAKKGSGLGEGKFDLSKCRYHFGSLCFKFGGYPHPQLCLVPQVQSLR